MRQHRTIARTLLILPIIGSAFARPVAVREALQVSRDAVPGVAIPMEKRIDKMEALWGMYFERLSGKPESDLEGLKGLLHYGPELTKSPSFDHYLTPELPEPPPTALTKSPSLDHFLASPEPSEFPPLDHSAVSTDSKEAGSPPTEKPGSESVLSKLASKIKFWRRISGPGTVRDAVNAARTELEGLVKRWSVRFCRYLLGTNVLTFMIPPQYNG